MSRAELKSLAKQRLSQNWKWAVGLWFIGSVMASIISFVTFGLLSSVVFAGVLFSFLALIDQRPERNIFTAIFSAFNGPLFLPVFLNQLLMGIFTMLWSLLFVIPGIVKSFSYSQSTYILKDMTKGYANTSNYGQSAINEGSQVGIFCLATEFHGLGIFRFADTGNRLFVVVTLYRCHKRGLLSRNCR